PRTSTVRGGRRLRSAWRTLAAGTVLAIVLPVAVLAGHGTGSSPLDSQTFSFRDTPLSTASTNWKDVPGLGGIVCAAGEVSASLSVTLSGAPVDVRVQVDKAG